MKRSINRLISLALAVACVVGFALLSHAYTADESLLVSKALQVVEYGKIKYATLYNINEVAKADLITAGFEARKKGGKVFFNFDTLSGDQVVARIVINPYLIKEETGSYNFKLDAESDFVKEAKQKLEKSLGKPVTVVRTPYDGYGMNVVIAVRLTIPDGASKQLAAYSYNAAAGTCQKLENSSCVVDDNGFVYFSTTGSQYLFVTTE